MYVYCTLKLKKNQMKNNKYPSWGIFCYIGAAEVILNICMCVCVCVFKKLAQGHLWKVGLDSIKKYETKKKLNIISFKFIVYIG